MEKKENEKEKKEKDKKENEKDKKEKDKKEKEKDKKEKVKTPTHLLQKKTKKENNNNNIINNNTNQQRQNLNSKQNQRRILQHPNNKTNNNNNIPKTQNNQNQITPEQNNQNQQINQNNNQIEQIDIQNNNQIVQNDNQNNNQINQNDNQNNNQIDQNDNQNIPPLPLNVFQAFQNDPVFNIFLNSFQNNNNNQSQINNNQPPKREVTDPTEIKIKELIPKEFNKIFNLQSSDYQSLLTFLESKETNKKLFCTKLFRNEGGIICKDCSLESNAVICFDCFEDTKEIHKKHNVILKTLLSGNCDCGNPEIWKEESFCKNHKIKQIKNKKSSFDNEIIEKINNFFEEIFKIILPYFIKCEEEKNIAKNQTLFKMFI